MGIKITVLSIRNKHHIPELSYSVINSKTTLEIAALGKHSIGLTDPATLNDRFHIGSNTKAMTAFIIAKYIEKGKLKWKTKFFDLFPEWREKSKPEYANISLQCLLSHRAGIQPFQGENDPQIPDFKGTKQEKRNQFGQFVLTLKPVKPDKQNLFIYSNAGDKKRFEEDLKSIIKENEEQSRKIKFIELKDKVRNLLKDNILAGALEFANAALEIVNDDKDLLNLKGIILCRLNQMKEAVEVFQFALSKNPTDKTTILNATECYFFAKEIDSAKELITQNKIIFDEKDNVKILELFNIVELFFSEKKDELLDIAKKSVNINDLKTKRMHFTTWNLKEAQHFIHFQPENELKTIVKNLFWYYDAQISGETLLSRLKIVLPSESTDFKEYEEGDNPI